MAFCRTAIVTTVLAAIGSSAAAQLLFDDPLTNGTTIGVRDNGQGQFVVAQGWKVTSYSDNIRYTPMYPIEDGALEFDIKGLVSSDRCGRPPAPRIRHTRIYSTSIP